MAKFQKFEPREHIRGLAEAVRQIQIEELTRDQDISFPYGANAPSSLDQGAIARQKKSSGSKREREESRRVK
jgi:hypothetical protein